MTGARSRSRPGVTTGENADHRVGTAWCQGGVDPRAARQGVVTTQEVKVTIAMNEEQRLKKIANLLKRAWSMRTRAAAMAAEAAAMAAEAAELEYQAAKLRASK